MSVQTSDIDEHIVRDFAPRVLAWYDASARVLPWRIAPGSDAVPDPYRIWLAEVMLQQTTVAAVAGYFARFTECWPTVADLAAAEDADVMAAWAGLGYYARARNLLACARAVVAEHGGRFPESEAALRALPGIGDYTAASVAAIAFGRPAVVVDANIERVMARHRLIATPLPLAKREIRAALMPLVPQDRPGDFAQALMDLGATICTPRSPVCAICPLMADCRARGRPDIERLPVKPPKKAKPRRHGLAHWIVREERVWLVRRPGKGMLGGMRALPGGDWTDTRPTESGVAEVNHGFTHFDLTLKLVHRESHDAAAEGEWWPISDLDAAGLPTLYRKLIDKMLERDG
ncbi:A/G-specific adenine glycosylase [Sphingopyxis bauzanensis]|uniref:A/G-specific adenine glycosylase n=1 Tax=Sphingopyxis bauzanensis TaxID=651663 RepID=UPI0019AD5EF7|nr:A/G-specific adenine glycosylase [Sphingopyxis bauzanensis]GGJ34136.1 A/G-specific adenine glycosylase [Sphingopyxis bauzanensis]